MKIKRTLSILLIAAMLLSMIAMAASATTRVTSLYGWVEYERTPNAKIDIKFHNDDLFEDKELLLTTVVVQEFDGTEYYMYFLELLLPKRGVDLSELTIKNIHIDGATVKDLIFSADNVIVKMEFLIPDHDLPFYDISKRDWFFKAAEYTYHHQLMNGAENHTFAPNENTTREQMVTVIWRMHGSPKAGGKLRFTDVKKSSYAKEAIVWATENGIVKGVSDTAFAPAKSITREQLVTLFYRYTTLLDGSPASGNTAVLSRFRDAQSVSPYAETAMSWAITSGLINGVSKNTLDPHGTAVRAQIATILMRYNQK